MTTNLTKDETFSCESSGYHAPFGWRARPRRVARVITGLAHVAVCVPDVDAAVAWYEDVLGLRVLSPPYRIEGEAITRDMGALVPAPVVLRAAIVGLGDDDHVLEVIEYPEAPGQPVEGRPVITDHGLTHVGLICDDVAATRQTLQTKGVEFLTGEPADIAGVKTTWFRDPWGVVFILVQKRRVDRPYWRQFGA